MMHPDPRPGDSLSSHPSHSEGHDGTLRDSWGKPVCQSPFSDPLKVNGGIITDSDKKS